MVQCDHVIREEVENDQLVADPLGGQVARQEWRSSLGFLGPLLQPTASLADIAWDGQLTPESDRATPPWGPPQGAPLPAARLVAGSPPGYRALRLLATFQRPVDA
jgi:hypothetical protein